ncbi:MAG: alpha/beta fold hydrolase [Alphaproteobacteria bacterium]|nr:alpha/beta fold hydrolase [Alphaproteobacteria bacterium]
MQTAATNGIKLAYTIDGTADKPWIVLSHSLATDHRMWAPQISVLEQTHRVLRYDTRGHGGSDAPSGDYTISTLVDDLAGLLEVLEIKDTDVMGISLGGATAIGLALGHPGLVRRVICCDAMVQSTPEYANGWRERIEIAAQQGMDALWEGSSGRWLTKEYRADPKNAQTLAQVREMFLGTSVDGFSGCAAALTTLNYESQLPSLAAPCLCITGSEDVAAPPEVMGEIASAVADGELEVIDDAAHLSNLNQPEKFNRIVSEWLDH